MRLPEIRYPLFWIVGAALLVVAARLGWPRTEPLRAAVAAGWKRVVEGPPVPASPEPMRLAGPIARRVLLLDEGTAVRDRPGGRVVKTIGRRIFADLYDRWPIDPATPATHLRIGNLRPVGWIDAAAGLPWDTRLVLRVPDAPLEGPLAGSSPGALLPIVEAGPDHVQVAVWGDPAGWRDVEGRTRIALGDVPREALGVLLSGEEVSALLREAVAEDPGSAREILRLRAVTGRVLDRATIGPGDLPALRAALPAWVMDGADDATGTLARLNAERGPEVALSGVGYRFVPLGALP